MTKRLKILLILAVLTGVIASTLGPTLRNQATAWLLLRQHSPDPTAITAVVTEAGRPERMLRRFWETERIPHRYAVAHFLGQMPSAPQGLSKGLRDLLVAATTDADHSTRELALGAWARLEPDALPGHLTRLFYDTDQASKLAALNYVRKLNNHDLMPEIMRLIEDPDPLVVASVTGILRRWTGQDFGVRSHDAIAKPSPEGHQVIPEENEARLRAGAQKWLAWWAEQQAQFPPVDLPPAEVAPPKLTAADFTLKDMAGEVYQLSKLRGKTVLLNFWTTWCTACAAEIPDLIALHKHFGEELVILGISLDGSDGHGHDHAAFVDLEEAHEKGWGAVEGLQTDHNHDHDHDHDHEPAAPDIAGIKKKLERTIKRKGIPYPILLNPTGDIGNRFNGNELPTNVLIDKEGFVRRRFIGTRPFNNWIALIEEIQ